VLANAKTDGELITLVRKEISPLAVVRIDRRSMWGNPFKMKKESERDLVCERYKSHFVERGLVQRVEELRRKLLVCWCYPKRCHGNFLLGVLGEGDGKEAEAENEQAGT